MRPDPPAAPGIEEAHLLIEWSAGLERAAIRVDDAGQVVGMDDAEPGREVVQVGNAEHVFQRRAGHERPRQVGV